LTGMQATGWPGWATLGSAIGAELPDDVNDVIFLAENDGGPNQKALDKACPALVARGVRVPKNCAVLSFPPRRPVASVFGILLTTR
jgi:hypothetical protein